jgi:hypothetical protein
VIQYLRATPRSLSRHAKIVLHFCNRFTTQLSFLLFTVSFLRVLETNIRSRGFFIFRTAEFVGCDSITNKVYHKSPRKRNTRTQKITTENVRLRGPAAFHVRIFFFSCLWRHSHTKLYRNDGDAVHSITYQPSVIFKEGIKGSVYVHTLAFILMDYRDKKYVFW